MNQIDALMPFHETIGLGCLGGIVPDLLRVVQARHEPAPEYLSRWFFWVSLLVLTILGGVAAYVVEPSKGIEAVAVGFSAPTIISQLLATPMATGDEGVKGFVRKRHYGGFNHATSPSRFEPIDALREWWGGRTSAETPRARR